MTQEQAEGTATMADPVLLIRIRFCKRLAQVVAQEQRIVPKTGFPPWVVEDGAGTALLEQLGRIRR
jgi:hypothetical protein